MTALLGTSLVVFIIVTVIIVGFAAMMTGNALANHWRPPWQGVVYSVLLAGVSRFLIFGVFDGDLLSPTGFLIDAVVLNAICALAYRITRARRMMVQYPWLYERDGLLSWREKGR